MSKKLVAFFSAGGVTADAAKKIAQAVNADLYEIRPEVPYTAVDLDWNDKSSRSSVEMGDRSFRPTVADRDANVANYDVVLLGFPIWWYTAPTIINTFLESYDFSGKTIILFATSGSTGFDKSAADLKVSVSSSAVIKEGVVIHGKQSADNWKQWVDGLGL